MTYYLCVWTGATFNSITDLTMILGKVDED